MNGSEAPAIIRCPVRSCPPHALPMEGPGRQEPAPAPVRGSTPDWAASLRARRCFPARLILVRGRASRFAWERGRPGMCRAWRARRVQTQTSWGATRASALGRRRGACGRIGAASWLGAMGPPARRSRRGRAVARGGTRMRRVTVAARGAGKGLGRLAPRALGVLLEPTPEDDRGRAQEHASCRVCARRPSRCVLPNH